MYVRSYRLFKPTHQPQHIQSHIICAYYMWGPLCHENLPLFLLLQMKTTRHPVLMYIGRKSYRVWVIPTSYNVIRVFQTTTYIVAATIGRLYDYTYKSSTYCQKQGPLVIDGLLRNLIVQVKFNAEVGPIDNYNFAGFNLQLDSRIYGNYFCFYVPYIVHLDQTIYEPY